MPAQPLGLLDHVGILVADLDPSIAFAETVLGASVESRFDDETRGVRGAFLRLPPIRLEFIEIYGDDAFRRERLGIDQARIDHVALRVDDVTEAAAAMRSSGVAMATDEPVVAGDARMFFTTPTSSKGVRYQLLELPIGA